MEKKRCLSEYKNHKQAGFGSDNKHIINPECSFQVTRCTIIKSLNYSGMAHQAEVIQSIKPAQ